MRFKMGCTLFMIAICFVCGIFLLLVGATETWDAQRETENYQETVGSLSDYTVYSSDEDGTTYRLIYTYTVDGRDYTVAADMGTEIVPKIGSTRTIRFNPDHPAEAVIAGGGSHGFMLLMGILFTFVPLIFLFVILYSLGYLQKLFDNFMGVTLGVLFLVMGLGLIYIMTGTLSVMEIVRSFSALLIIPLLFVAVGVLQIVRFFIHLMGKKGRQERKTQKAK